MNYLPFRALMNDFIKGTNIANPNKNHQESFRQMRNGMDKLIFLANLSYYLRALQITAHLSFEIQRQDLTKVYVNH